VLITIAAFIIGWSVLIMVYNLISSARSKELAPMNPWGSRSPEWQIPYPVPEFNYEQPFEVVGDPYGYGAPDDPEYVKMHVAPVPSGD
jgi:cytochrome c oxidase subunit 1